MKAAGKYILALTTQTDEVTGEVKPLFAFPVDLCRATDDIDVTFDVAAPSGVKRQQQFIDPATGEVVPRGEELHGVFADGNGGDFRAIDKDVIDAINAEEKITTMVVDGRIDLDQARAEYADWIEGRYFVQSPAKGGSAVAYRLVYEALRADNQAILVKRTKSTKQARGFIFADEDEQCLVLAEFRFDAEMRHSDDQLRAPMTAQVAQAQIDKARKVIAAMPTGVEKTQINTLNPLKQQLIDQALAGEAITVPTPVAVTAQTDDLEALLDASLAM